ncbi:MAG: hypothetical protein V1702_05875 [Candidatus Woesearchaeota archaeon]
MKKASFFVPATTIFVAITLITAIVLLQIKADDALKIPIGARQFTLFSTYQRAENAMDYVEVSSKYAMESTIFALANNSGFYGESKCGRFGSFNSWGWNSECYPIIRSNFSSFFNQILNYTYLTKHDDEMTSEGKKGLNLSKLYNSTQDDIISLIGFDGQTRLAMKQLGPRLNISFAFKEEQINHSIKFSFRQSTEPDIIAITGYVKDKAGTLYPAVATRRQNDPLEDIFDGKTYKWYNGGCVNDQAEKFFKFVEAFQDCAERIVDGFADEYGQWKAKCDSYDLSQIETGYSYVILPEPDKGRTRLALKKDGKELWGTYVYSNFAFAYRYTCPNGKADCAGPRPRECNNDLTNDEVNCKMCGNIIWDSYTPRHSCVDGTADCVPADLFGAECSIGDTEPCTYVCDCDCCDPTCYSCGVDNDCGDYCGDCPCDPTCYSCGDDVYNDCGDPCSCSLPPPPPPPPPYSSPPGPFCSCTGICLAPDTCGAGSCYEC